MWHFLGNWSQKPARQGHMSPPEKVEEGACWVGSCHIPEVGPRGSPSWAPADSPSRLGGRRLEIPHPLLCEWKRKPKCTRDLCALSGWPSVVMVVVAGGSFLPPRQEGPPQLPFWGPTPLFPISPLRWGGGHCFPRAMDSADLSASGTSG